MKKTFGISLSKFRHQSVFQLTWTISLLRLQSNSTIANLDTSIWSFARENGIPSDGLEPIGTQENIFNDLENNYALANLKTIIKNWSNQTYVTHSLLKSYEKQNIKRLYHLGKRNLGKLRHKLIYNRNRIMTESIMQHKTDTRLFVAVGAGHLWGNKGLLALLKRNKYIVKPELIPHFKKTV